MTLQHVTLKMLFNSVKKIKNEIFDLKWIKNNYLNKVNNCNLLNYCNKFHFYRSVAKLNDKSGCAVFHFDQTDKATAAGDEGTIWKIKQARRSPMESPTKMKEEITKASMGNSTTDKNVSDTNLENSTKTAENELSDETSTEKSSTKTAAKEEDPEPEDENNEPEASREKIGTCAVYICNFSRIPKKKFATKSDQFSMELLKIYSVS